MQVRRLEEAGFIYFSMEQVWSLVDMSYYHPRFFDVMSSV